MSEETLRSVVQYGSWPIIALLVIIFFLMRFAPAIIRLIDRIKGYKGIDLEPLASQSLPPASGTSQALAAFLNSFDNPLLVAREAAVRAELEQRGLISPEDARDALIRALAGTQILMDFERVQSAIWKSQVEMLTVLNAFPSEVAEKDIQPMFDAAAQGNPELYGERTFDTWLGFLETQGLLVRHGGGVAITVLGREFLKWRIDSGALGPFHG